MKNKEKYNVKNLNFGMVNCIDDYVYFFVESEAEDLYEEHKFSIMDILDYCVKSTFKMYSSDDINSVDDTVEIFIKNKTSGKHGFMEVNIQAALDLYHDYWSDLWLEEESKEDE